jgi:hypothetical protein
MAVAFDAQSKDSAVFQAGTSFSWNHTFSGSNRYAVVSIFTYTPVGTLTAPTIGGVSMTQLQVTDLSGLNKLWLFGLVAPATGSQSIAFSFSSSNSFVAAVATSYTGVDQTNPIDVSAIANKATTGSTYNPAITSTVDNAWVVGTFRATQGSSYSASVGTLRDGANALAMYNWDSNAPQTPAGTYTATITSNAGSDLWSGIIASLKPAVGGGATYSSNLLLMGVT